MVSREFDRSQKPNSTRCGVISSQGNRKGPKFWSVEKGARAGATLSIPRVSLPTQLSLAWSTYPLGKVFADVKQEMTIVSTSRIC